MMHVGQGLVCGDKIQDLIRAGFEFTIFLADYHSMINNKYGGDLQKIRTTGEYFQDCFTALGVPRRRSNTSGHQIWPIGRSIGSGCSESPESSRLSGC